jgi:hypothetical protein
VDPVETLEHPRWCDRSHCTATVPRPEYRAGETGFHRSAPITVGDIPNVGDIVLDPDLNPLVAFLAQPAPPWEPVTYLKVGTMAEPEFLSLTAAQARAAMRQLDALVTLAAADEPQPRADP